MSIIFTFITKAFDFILYPFSTLAPIFGVAFLSLLTALLILWTYARVSNQRKIRLLRKRVQGYFLGIYLFRDDLTRIGESLLKIFSNSLLYIGHSLKPLAVVIIPISLVCIQMQLRYGYSSLKPGDTILITAGLSLNERPSMENIEIHTTAGLTLESPPLRIAKLNEINWDVKVDRQGEQRITFLLNGAAANKDLYVGGNIHRIYPVTRKASLWNTIVHPGGETINKNSLLQYIKVEYQPARIGLMGIHLHWSINYFLLAIIFGMLLKRSFGVEF